MNRQRLAIAIAASTTILAGGWLFAQRRATTIARHEFEQRQRDFDDSEFAGNRRNAPDRETPTTKTERSKGNRQNADFKRWLAQTQKRREQARDADAEFAELDHENTPEVKHLRHSYRSSRAAARWWQISELLAKHDAELAKQAQTHAQKLWSAMAGKGSDAFEGIAVSELDLLDRIEADNGNDELLALAAEIRSTAEASLDDRLPSHADKLQAENDGEREGRDSGEPVESEKDPDPAEDDATRIEMRRDARAAWKAQRGKEVTPPPTTNEAQNNDRPTEPSH